MKTWPAPTAPTPVRATVTVPGSKSQTNRALVLAALAAAQGRGASTISGALRSRDTELMLDALQTLGLRVDGVGSELTVSGRIEPGPGARVDCGLAGTVLRFVPPLAALGSVPVTFDGDQQARGRPIAPLLDALRELGVAVDGTGLPFRVRGNGSLAGGTVAIDASASSQFVSGLLLSAASFTDGLTVQHTGSSLPSAPHIAMTAAMLRQAGVDIDDSTPNRWQVRPGPVAARRWDIEPDLTNAVAFLSAAVVSGGTVRITGWPRVSVQPADHILAILRQLNAVVIHADSSLEVRGPTGYDGFDVDLRAVGELTPSVAALAALASPGSVSRLSGIAHLRGHETDRLAALSTEINRLGGTCRETPDGLVITATPLRPGIWRAYADHRMAMPARSLGCGWPESRSTTSPPPPRRCRSFRGCGPRWSDPARGGGTPSRAAASGRGGQPGRGPAVEARRLRRVRRQGALRQEFAPRTKTRPEHADAEAAMVVSVDRGRWGCVLGGRPDRRITAMRARELGRTPIVVGDDVDVVGDLSGRPDTLARIVRRAPRRTVLRRTADDTDPTERVVVANADQLLIVVALADPPPRTGLVDRALIAAYAGGLTPILCLTKTDLAPAEPFGKQFADLELTVTAAGVDDPLLAVADLLAGKITVLLGHSGVGKSTLVNRLVPEADRAVGEVTEIGRGRHTSTRSVALPLGDTLSGSGWVIDTPGIRSFGLAHIQPDNVLLAFSDLAEATRECPRGCGHMGPPADPECALDTLSGPAARRAAAARRLLAVLSQT